MKKVFAILLTNTKFVKFVSGLLALLDFKKALSRPNTSLDFLNHPR